MARGFESKDVEFQQEEAYRLGQPARAAAKRDLDAKQRSIELTLLKARADREAATHPQHQKMLDDAIVSLEGQLLAVR